MKRQDGYYWVKWYGQWHVALWGNATNNLSDACWTLSGLNNRKHDIAFDQIIEQRLKEPEDNDRRD